MTATGEKTTDEGDATSPRDDGEPLANGDETPTDGDGTAALVRIVDIPDAVSGGEFLDWTVEVENPTDRAVRPTVDVFVDGESLGSTTLTVGPGETARPTMPSYRTEPVARDDEVAVRVETAGDADERSVRVLAVDELDDQLLFPERTPTVEPETTVHFEVGTVDPEAFQTTTWWVDGENVGDTLASPWQGIYFAERGAHFWQETFDARGTYEVVAGVEVDDEQYRASWTVTVAPDGLADPTIDATRPEQGALALDEEGQTTLEADVSDPDGNLDRVVWWLSQADTILGESEVSGAADTATLTVDGGLCHTCRIIPWVITADGTFTTDSLWTVDGPGVEAGDGDTDDGPLGTGLDVTITGTNDPVDAGSVLEVTVDCTNAGTESIQESLDLIVGHDPECVDTRSVSVAGDTTKTTVLEFETAFVANDQSFPARVETDSDDTDECTVQVWGHDGTR